MTRRLVPLALHAAVLVLVSCSSDGTAPPPPPTQLAFAAPPNGGSAGTPLGAVTVQARDAAGDIATNASQAVSVSITNGTGPAGATLLGTLTRNAVNGVATFDDLEIRLAGSGYTLTAAASGLTSATSASFTVAPGAASRLVVSNAPASATAGQALAPAVTVRIEDAFGNLAAGATNTVTLAIAAGTSGAVIGGTISRAAQAGEVTFDDVTIDRSGAAYTLTASAATLASAVTPAFPVLVSVRIVRGASQTGISGFELGDSVVAEVQDPIGTPLASVPLAWSATGGTLSSAATLTSAAGRAAVAWRVGDGTRTLTVSGAGNVATTSAGGLARTSCSFFGTASNGSFREPDTTLVRPVTRTLRVAALFVDFPDLAATRTVAQMMSDIITPAVQMLGATTDGQLQLEIVPAASWLRMPENAGDMRWSDFLTHRAYIATILDRYDATFDFSTIDVVWFFRPSRFDPQVLSGVMNLKQNDFWAVPLRDSREMKNFITFGGDATYMDVYEFWPKYGTHIVAHEMGHILGLPDLYAYTSAPGEDGIRFTGGWSWMGWVAPASSWFAAERLYLGVMPAADALCAPQQPHSAVATLRPVEEATGLRGIGLRSGPSRVTFLEVRQRVGLDSAIFGTGLLVYDVNGDVPGGQGPIVVREIHPSPAGPEKDRFGGKWNAPAKVGDVIELGDPNVTVTVLSEAADGSMTVRIVRR